MKRIAPEAQLLYRLGQWYAAGFYEEPQAPLVLRTAHALRAYLDHAPLPGYEDGRLYPAGAGTIWYQAPDQVMCYSYSFSFDYRRGMLEKLIAEAAPPDRALLTRVLSEQDNLAPLPGSPKYWVGGHVYTHSILNYGRILREGWGRYAERIAAALAATTQPEQVAFYEAVGEVLAALVRYQGRCLAALREHAARAPSPELAALSTALAKVPLAPAEDFYEALVSVNFAFFVDGCDSIGRFDQFMAPYYERSRAAGRLSDSEVVELLREFWRNFDRHSGWNMALGGTDRNGAPAYHDFTYLCLESMAGMRRPNCGLRIRPDMPDRFWDRALDTIATAGGNPSLYNEDLYLANIPSLTRVPGPDRADFAFGGCTELMFQGISYVGSLDAGINLPQVLEGSLRAHLPGASDFAALLAACKLDLHHNLRQLMEEVNVGLRLKAVLRPQLIRSLFIDDCLDRGLEYHAGGARINGSVINVGGFANAVNSLYTVRCVLEGRLKLTREELLDSLEANYQGREAVLAQVRALPKYGNHDPEVDAMAADLADHVFSELGQYRCAHGDGYVLPSCLMFVTFAYEGLDIGATPDGRLAAQPIADSIGPMQGTDREGPTAMLLSVAAIPQHKAIGTLVLNALFSREVFTSAASRQRLKHLIQTYFAQGGMQLQLTVADPDMLRDAMAHPEKYESFVVRVGGYTEYFNRLPPELKEEVLKRACLTV